MHLFTKHVLGSDYVLCTENKSHNPPLEEPAIIYVSLKWAC